MLFNHKPLWLLATLSLLMLPTLELTYQAIIVDGFVKAI